MKTHISFSVTPTPPPENHAVYERTWKNIVDLGRPRMKIRRMRISHWAPEATNTHSGCVIHIAFPLQQWLHECTSLLRCTYIACIVWCVSSQYSVSTQYPSWLTHVALYWWSTGLVNMTVLAKMKKGVAMHEVCSVECIQEFELPVQTSWWQPCWMYIVFCRRREDEVYSFRHAYRMACLVGVSPVVIPSRKCHKHGSDSQGLRVYDDLNEGE